MFIIIHMIIVSVLGSGRYFKLDLNTNKKIIYVTECNKTLKKFFVMYILTKNKIIVNIISTIILFLSLTIKIKMTCKTIHILYGLILK